MFCYIKENEMAKKRFILGLVFALLSTVFAAGVAAQVTISGGFALSSIKGITIEGYNEGITAETGIGGNVYADYLVPLGIPLSLGFEIGIDSGKFAIDNSDYKDETVTVIPLLIRAAYHFDLIAKLDLYVVGKVGYAIGFWEGKYKKDLENMGVTVDNLGGIAFGFDAGAAYYFSPVFGVFAEVGFDDYALKGDISGTGNSMTLEAPFNRFLTVGISTKF
jgi:predicted porin